MRHFLLVSLLSLLTCSANAQQADDWFRLRHYAQAIDVDSLCATPDSACLSRYFTQIIYGRTPRLMSYQGVPESSDRHYRQLIAYCMRCLVDDYMGDSLTIEQVQETLNTYRWLNRFRADKRIRSLKGAQPAIKR